MYITMSLFISSIVTVSVIFAGDTKFDAKTATFSDQSINNSNINLSIEAEEDIYGIQFDIRYNSAQLSLTEDKIVSKVPDAKIYSRIREDGIARVLMFGMAGEKLFDVAAYGITDLIDIQFNPKEKFIGTSIVELLDITVAGKAGMEIDISSSSIYAFEVSFLTPQGTSLSKNFPNPFNPTTTINYELSEAGMVSLIIYDLKGALVKTLVEEYQEAQYHNIIWNGLNDNGQTVPSGRYILKMSTIGFSDTITMTLLK